MSKDVWGYQPRPEREKPDWEINPQTAAVREGLARSGFGEHPRLSISLADLHIHLHKKL